MGIRTLAQGLRALGAEVTMLTPSIHLPVFTAERILFNELSGRSEFDGDAIVGFDLDGYRVAGRPGRPHVAAIKGVLGDAVRFESGFTRASLALQAKLEKLHARRADRVITVSRYCAAKLRDLYGIDDARVVPELIDLEAWRRLFQRSALAASGRFTVLCVCRFYPRKRVDILLRAAALLRAHLPELEVRIVGGGPQAPALHRLAGRLGLDSVVSWVGNVSDLELAREYTRADLFCLPSVQEGFGIVFLEAMAAGKPIVAARAAAVPEVVEQGELVEPNNPEALAHGIARLYSDSELRARLSAAGLTLVQKYDILRVARAFLAEIP